MVMKTGRNWLLVESSKLQDHRQRNCVINNVTVESVELSDHDTIRYDTIEEFNVDSKAEYTA